MNAIELLKQHIPSITDEIEDELNERVSRAAISYDPNDGDSADCALRVCHCGERIDGFYEYAEHLESVFRFEALLDQTVKNLEIAGFPTPREETRAALLKKKAERT